jgi:putative membrane protein
MREFDFFRDTAKRQASDTVEGVEAQTSAEVVISVRRRAGTYRVVAYHFGFALWAAVTAYLLVTPRVFSMGAIALDGVAAFLLGVVVCANVDGLLRAVTPKKTRKANVETAARAAFFDLGISRTRGRNGILVFVSTFERTLCVLTDIGIDVAALGTGWEEARRAMDDAIRRMDWESFLAGVEKLGPVLGRAMPRMADDVNELSNEVQ